jgi:hypothetical protein
MDNEEAKQADEKNTKNNIKNQKVLFFFIDIILF